MNRRFWINELKWFGGIVSITSICSYYYYKRHYETNSIVYELMQIQNQQANNIHHLPSQIQSIQKIISSIDSFNYLNDQKKIEFYLLLGALFEKNHQPARALDTYKQLLDLSSIRFTRQQQLVVWTRIATVYEQLNRPQEVLRCYRHAYEHFYRRSNVLNREIEPQQIAGMLYNYACFLLDQQQFKQAQAILRQAREIQPVSPEHTSTIDEALANLRA